MNVFLGVSAAVFLLGVICALCAPRGRIRPIHALFGGTFLAIGSLLLPAPPGPGVSVNTVLQTLHTVIRVFLADGGLEFLPPGAGAVYTGWGTALFILAPVLTFGYVLSFFQNAMAHIRLAATGWMYRRWYVLSRLNEEALAFAKSIPEEEKGLVIFASSEDASENLIAEARELGAVLMGNAAPQGVRPWGKTRALFFAIGRDARENTAAALEVIKLHGARPNTELYVVARDEADMLALNAALPPKDGITVRHVTPELSLAYQTLFASSIFETAIPGPDGKRIAVVALGLGGVGAELTKALCWLGQMDGYRIEIQVFEQSPAVAARFAAQFPSLLEHSGKGGDGEDHYSLELYSGVNFYSQEFHKLVRPPSLVYVALGSDSGNIAAALEARALFERMGCTPRITAFVYDTAQAESLCRQALRNFRGQLYDVEIRGGLSEQFDYRNITHSDLEERALLIHSQDGRPEQDFYRYHYFYRSSVSSAIHAKWRGELRIPESPVTEHMRWIAYMRGIGYRFAPVRNDRAKTHPSMVSYYALSAAEQEKDIHIVKQ